MPAMLERLRENMATCRRCPDLVASRTQVVFGDGPANARWVVVGESPGVDEDRIGIPFIGRSGKRARALLLVEGLDPDEAFWLNALGCHPEKNRDPKRSELDNCARRLYLTLGIIKPEVILTFGLPAWKAVCRVDRRARVGMGDVRGKLTRIAVQTRRSVHTAALVPHLAPGVHHAAPG